MKRLVKMVCLVIALASYSFADMVVPASALPQNAQQFISANFKGANVMYVEQDYDDFEVRLSDGTKIDFWRDGNWKEIQSYSGVNLALLPQPVAKTISASYPNVAIVEAEKQWNGYKIKMANMLKLYIDLNGNLIGQKYDD